MLVTLFGVFIILHGLVHLLYMLHAQKKIQLSNNLNWPDRSWLFSRTVSECQCGRTAASLLLISAIGFISAVVLFFIDFSVWKMILLTTAIYSTMVYIIMWNGKFKRISDQGLIGILINIGILIIVFYYNWPV